jgi:hydrogenase expression/formation protein HypC
MCLAVPGRIVSIREDDTGGLDRTGRVDFGGLSKEVSLACTPGAGVGDYVLVHVGMAIGVVDAAEATRVLGYLAEIEALDGSASAGGTTATGESPP